MAERDLRINLDARLKSGGGEGLKSLQRTVQNLGKDAEKTFREFNKAQDAAEKSAKRLEKALRSTGGTGKKSLEQLAEAAAKANARLEETRKKLQVASRPSFGERLKGFAGGAVETTGSTLHGIAGQSPFGGFLSKATVALAAFTTAVKAAATITEMHYAGMQFNPTTGTSESNIVGENRAFKKKQRAPSWMNFWQGGEAEYRREGDSSRADYEKYRQQQGNAIHRFGRWVTGDKSNPMTYEQFQLNARSGTRQDYMNFEARQGISIAGQESSAESSRISGKFGLRSEMTRLESEAKAAQGMRRAGYGIQAGAAGARSVALAGLAKNATYNRAEQFGDISRQIGMRESLLHIGAEGKFKQQAIGTQIEQSEAQARHQEGRFGRAKKEEQKALADVKNAQELKLTNEEINRLADVAAGAAERRRAAEEAMMEAQRRTIELRKSGEQAVLQTQQQEHALLKSNLDAVTKQREALKLQRQQSTERLGLLHPMQQRTILGVARKIQQHGIGSASQGEIRLMQQHGDVFGNVLQKIGMKRGGGLMDQLKAMPVLGLQNREKALEKQAMQLKQEINARIVIDENSLSDQLVKKISPEVHKAIKQIEEQFNNRINAMWNQFNAQRRANYGR